MADRGPDQTRDEVVNEGVERCNDDRQKINSIGVGVAAISRRPLVRKEESNRSGIKVAAISRMPLAWKQGVNHRVVGAASRKQNKQQTADSVIATISRRLEAKTIVELLWYQQYQEDRQHRSKKSIAAAAWYQQYQEVCCGRSKKIIVELLW
jgi:fumarylacetoacetate (FAA) hydrolase family protein